MKAWTFFTAFVGVAILAGTALAQPQPRHPAEKRAPLGLLKDAVEKLKTVEGALENKPGKNKLKEIALEIKETRLQIQEFIVEVEGRKVLLPAYECCPCHGTKDDAHGEGEGTVEVNVTVNTGEGETDEPVEPPEEKSPEPIQQDRFDAVLKAVGDQGFSNDKLTVLKQAARDAFFTVNQVLALIREFSFPDDKLEVLRQVKSRIVDTENLFQVYGAFVYPSDKDEAKKILEGP